jgi:hypothetical protein
VLTLSDLLAPLTTAQVLAILLGLCAQLGLPVTSWQSGGVAMTILTVVATVYAAFTQVIVAAVGGGLLDYAVAGWLTLLASNVYNVTRITATFASASQAMLLSNAGGGQYIIEPGDLTFSQTIGGVKYLYTNTSGGTLAAWSGSGPNTTLALDVAAVTVGTASNANPNTITTLETTLLGVTCTNTISVLGQDDETDPLLRARCRAALGALSPNGPKLAYYYFATSAMLNGISCGVTRVKIPTPPGDGSLTVYVAGYTGGISGTVGDLTTPLGVVDSDIQNNVVPEGVGPVTVASASNHAIALFADVYVNVAGNQTTPDIQASIDLAMSNTNPGGYFQTLPIGGQVSGVGKVFLNALIGVIERSNPWIVYATLSSPGVDVTMAAGDVPIYGGTTITIHQVTV